MTAAQVDLYVDRWIAMDEGIGTCNTTTVHKDYRHGVLPQDDSCSPSANSDLRPLFLADSDFASAKKMSQQQRRWPGRSHYDRHQCDGWMVSSTWADRDPLPEMPEWFGRITDGGGPKGIVVGHVRLYAAQVWEAMVMYHKGHP